MKTKKAPKAAQGSKAVKGSKGAKVSKGAKGKGAKAAQEPQPSTTAKASSTPLVPAASTGSDRGPEGVLDDDEVRLWQAWKGATERVGAAVAGDIGAETGLSDPEVAILMSVAQGGGGSIRQSELAARLDWHRSRLSHQLTRMQGKGLVTRSPAGDGVEVSLTPAGAEAAARAIPVRSRAVRVHLVARLSARDRRRLVAILDVLDAPGTEPVM